MADKYEDFDSKKISNLEDEVEDILEEKGEVFNYDLAENHIDWPSIGWSRKTGEKALFFIREKWKENGKINVNSEKDGSVTRKKWVAT